MERFVVVRVNRDGNSYSLDGANTVEEAKSVMERNFCAFNNGPSALVYLLCERNLRCIVQGHGFPPADKPTLRFTF